MTSALSINGQAALLYAQIGWAVFPLYSIVNGRCACWRSGCSSPGKHPIHTGGFKTATKDEAAIVEAWTARPGVNVGIATGAMSGVWVLDVDPAHGGDESLAALVARHGALPETYTVLTGGGGRHLYFRHPGVEVPCSIGTLAKGLDVRGDGGYVVAPPSGHASGARYVCTDSRDPVDAPAWLLALAVAAKAANKSATKKNGTASAATARTPRDFGTAGGTAYGLAGLAAETHRVRTAPEGTRNATLNKAAFAVGQLVAGGELDEAVAKRALMDAALAAGLARDEAARTARSGFDKGAEQPRSAPPRSRAADGSGPADRVRGAPSLKTPNVSVAAGGTASGSAARNVPPWKAFPVDALPRSFADLVGESAASLGCDPSFVALPVLSVAAAAIGNSRTVMLKKSWVEPCVVWTAIVGESGTHKSPAQDIAFAPLRAREGEAQREHEENWKVYKSAKLRYDTEVSNWKRDGAKGEPPPEPERPVARRYVVGDATTEALAKLLFENPRGLLLARDELAGWLKSFDAYRGGQGGDAAFYLSAHGARQHVVDRKSAETPTIFVPRAALSIAGGIQPATFADSIGSQHRSDGLLARLLLSMPPRTASRWTEAVVDDLTRAAYASTIENLLALDLMVLADGRQEPVALPLTSDAKREWIAFFDAFSERHGNAIGDEAAALAKLISYAARFALIHQLARNADAEKIDAEAVLAGARLCTWFADEAARVYAVLVETPDEAARRHLVEWIAAAPRNGRTTVRDLMRGPRQYMRKAAAEAALAALVDAGLGTWEEDRHDGGRGRPVWWFVLATDAVADVHRDAEEDDAHAAVPPAATDTNGKSRLDEADNCQQDPYVTAGARSAAPTGAAS